MGEPGFRKIEFYWYCIALQWLVFFILVKNTFQNRFIKFTMNTNMFVFGNERYRVTVTGTDLRCKLGVLIVQKDLNIAC